MGIYISLIVYILMLPIVAQLLFKTQKRQRNLIVFWGMAAIYLILALKGNVGVDIPGYEEQYYLSAGVAWNDVSYVYFEPGYITLMKCFSKAGFSFQAFMAVIYAVSCGSMYAYIKRYSLNPTFSLVIFVCYQFFVFYISGVRQMLSMSLCLIAFMMFQKNTRKNKVMALVICWLASTIHEAALLFFVVFIFLRNRAVSINIMPYIVAIVAACFLRTSVFAFINRYIRPIATIVGIDLGGSFIMMLGFSLIMYFINSDTNIIKRKIRRKQLREEDQINMVFFTRMILLTTIAYVVFSGGTLLRGVMYLSIFLIVGLPNTTYRLNSRVRIILETALVTFFIILFYVDTLAINQLGLCPYVFFWE